MPSNAASHSVDVTGVEEGVDGGGFWRETDAFECLRTGELVHEGEAVGNDLRGERGRRRGAEEVEDELVEVLAEGDGEGGGGGGERRGGEPPLLLLQCGAPTLEAEERENGGVDRKEGIEESRERMGGAAGSIIREGRRVCGIKGREEELERGEWGGRRKGTGRGTAGLERSGGEGLKRFDVGWDRIVE